MRLLLCFASVGVVALAVAASAQEPKKESAKTELVKATYLVKGLH